MTSIAEKVVALHRSLDAASVPHAFGGALALAWCTRQPRGTSDIDLNVFVRPDSVAAVLDALPDSVTWREVDVANLERDGQSRLRWDGTPIDIFLNTTPFHEAVMGRVSFEPFGGQMIPFLTCSDLAVFKAFFNRRRDWADIEDMISARTVDTTFVIGVLSDHHEAGDERIAQLREVARDSPL